MLRCLLIVLALCVVALPETHAINHLRTAVSFGHRGSRCEDGGWASQLWDSYTRFADKIVDKLMGTAPGEVEKLNTRKEAIESLAVALKEATPASAKELTCQLFSDVSWYWLVPVQRTIWARSGASSDPKIQEQAKTVAESPNVKKAIAEVSAAFIKTGYKTGEPPTDLTFTEKEIAERVRNMVASLLTPRNLSGSLRQTFMAMKWDLSKDWFGIRTSRLCDQVAEAVAKSVPALKAKESRLGPAITSAVKSRTSGSLTLQIADKSNPLIKEATRIVALPDVAKAIAELNKELVGLGKFKEGAELQKAEQEILPDTRDKVVVGIISVLPTGQSSF